MRGGGSIPPGQPWISGKFCPALLPQGPGLWASLLGS